MSPERVLALVGGAATRKQLREHGLSDGRIAGSTAAGTVVRVRRGIYALPGADPVEVARVAWRCEPTCVTAARRLGLPTSSRDDRLHVAVASDRSSARPNAWPPRSIVVHMSGAIPLRVVGAADVIDSTARCVSRMEQLEMVDAALNMGLMLEGDIGGMRLTSARTRRWLARHCDGRSQSLLETRTRFALRAAGLRAQPQVPIPGVGRVDFLIDGKVVVETDGRATHALSAAFDTDRRRDRAALIAGYPVMRFGYADVMGDIDGVVEQVVAVVRAARAASR
ncbi:type IV toxin-antitoxin system AbiEi family antitoxin domain-containing protein [Demequina sp.]|uniref:type IV toxin-antitoxin system AbiEi family antitoxin domain-containing protein n=1 Tax=Demequina sp. TaxID=2050685 RepID=UPI0025C46EB0|nr:type IV toxin-antitoxin system AbiEi family antitoxin domain-containing protein [Demequina sp.]